MADYTREQNRADARRLADMLCTIYRCPMPTVGRMHGDCYAGGVGLAAVCDVRRRPTRAHFCLSEARLGLLPATISPYVIRAMGEQAARRYFLTAERFDAAEARCARLRARGRALQTRSTPRSTRSPRARRQRPGRGEGLQAAGAGRRRRADQRSAARGDGATHRRHPRQRRRPRRGAIVLEQARAELGAQDETSVNPCGSRAPAEQLR